MSVWFEAGKNVLEECNVHCRNLNLENYAKRCQ